MGSPAEFFFCIPTISPPPGGKRDFTFRPASEGITRRLPEGFFLPWDSGEGVGLSYGHVPNFASVKAVKASSLMY